MATLTWLLMKIVTWWGDFGQVGTCGVRSNPGLGHGEEISVYLKEFCSGTNIFLILSIIVLLLSEFCLDLDKRGETCIPVGLLSKGPHMA